MKHNIKEYAINKEENGRITLKLELRLQERGESCNAFTTIDAMSLIVKNGYCKSTKNLEVIKGGIAYNWGGSPNKADWTFKYHGEEPLVIKKEPTKLAKSVKPAIKKPVKEPKPVMKKSVEEPKTTSKKATSKKTTQDVLASIRTKGN